MSCSSLARLSSLKRLMGAALLSGALNGAGCAGDSLANGENPVQLAIDITALPASAQTIETAVALKRRDGWQFGGGVPLGDLSAFEKRDAVLINLVLPSEALYEDVSIGVRVQDAGGKLVALGSAQTKGYRQRAALVARQFSDPRSTRPMLVQVEPSPISRARVTDNTVAITVYGWGFQPNAKVQVDGMERTFDWESSAQLLVKVPKDSLTNSTATITVTNPDQASDTRSDLISVTD